MTVRRLDHLLQPGTLALTGGLSMAASNTTTSRPEGAFSSPGSPSPDGGAAASDIRDPSGTAITSDTTRLVGSGGDRSSRPRGLLDEHIGRPAIVMGGWSKPS
jgi:hypothetical protein